MFKIVKKEVLNPSVILMVIEAPLVARKAEPGQFIIFRLDEAGERVPLTIADFDREKGTVTIIFQVVGKSTLKLSQMAEGQAILDFVGPLGVASHFDGLKRVAVIGGGLGTAIAYPQAKKLHAMGITVDTIIGFRNQELIILEDEMQAVSDRLFATTDDGSNGHQGFVTDVLKTCIEAGADYDMVIAIGPIIMMKLVSQLTKAYAIKTIVSMNPIMVDGTGMCGGCRVTVDGQVKFACVDGPDFDGHLVDFDEAMRRQTMYHVEEKEETATACCQGEEATHA